MSRFNLLALTCAATFGLSALVQALPVSAQTSGSGASGFNGERIVTKVQQADLVALVRNNGDTVVSQKQQGDVSVLAETPDGLYYVLVGAACNLPNYGEGCLGIDFQVRYNADSRATTDKINLANRTYKAAKVSRGMNEEDEDTVFVSHYVILDGGQKMNNLATILINVLDFGPKAADIIWP